MAFSLVRAAGAGPGRAGLLSPPPQLTVRAQSRRLTGPRRRPGLASRAGRRSHARGRGPRGAVWGARGGAGSFLVTQAFGLKGAAALRGRPLGPRSCACRRPVASNIRPDGSWPRGREPGRPQHFLLPQPSHVRARAARSAGRSRLWRVALASRRRQGPAARCGRRSEQRRPPQAGPALGEARHDGADMAPLKPCLRAPRAGRALPEPGEVTRLHTFDCFWSPIPEGGPGQVRSHVRVPGLRGLSPGASRVWGARGQRWSQAAREGAQAWSLLVLGGVRSPHSVAWRDALMWPRGCRSAFLSRRGQVPKLGGVSGCRWVRVASSSDLRFGGAVTGRWAARADWWLFHWGLDATRGRPMPA